MEFLNFFALSPSRVSREHNIVTHNVNDRDNLIINRHFTDHVVLFIEWYLFETFEMKALPDLNCLVISTCLCIPRATVQHAWLQYQR